MSKERERNGEGSLVKENGEALAKYRGKEKVEEKKEKQKVVKKNIVEKKKTNGREGIRYGERKTKEGSEIMCGVREIGRLNGIFTECMHMAHSWTRRAERQRQRDTLGRHAAASLALR